MNWDFLLLLSVRENFYGFIVFFVSEVVKYSENTIPAMSYVSCGVRGAGIE